MPRTETDKRRLEALSEVPGAKFERSSIVARCATSAEESSVVQDEGDCIVLFKHTANAFQSGRQQCAFLAHCWDGATSVCIVTRLSTDRAREEVI